MMNGVELCSRGWDGGADKAKIIRVRVMSATATAVPQVVGETC